MSDEAAARSPTDTELLTTAIKSFLFDLHTQMPGQIVEYYPKEQKADVKPLLMRLTVHEDGEELLEALPIIPDVPIQFLRGGGFFESLPLKKGDLVMLHFQERSIDNYLSSDGVDTNPDEFRHHDLSDAVAVPGFYPFKKPITDINTENYVVGKDNGGVQIHLTPDGTMELRVGGVADRGVVLGEVLQAFWDTVVKPYIDTHVHPVPLGPGVSGPPAAPSPIFDASMISQVLRVKG